MNLARLGNKYLADEEPWKAIKDNPERVKTQMYVAIQIAGALAILSEPFLPFTAQKLKNILNFEALKQKNTWESIKNNEEIINTNHHLNPSELLFEKIDDEIIQKQLKKLENIKLNNKTQENVEQNTTIEPQKELISYDDFSKMDIRIGTILEAEKMPKADKLLLLKVDTGIDVRTIVSGIAESFNPQDIIGKKVTVLVNLAPRKLRGIESQGMILMTEDIQGKFVFLNPDIKDVCNGSIVK